VISVVRRFDLKQSCEELIMRDDAIADTMELKSEIDLKEQKEPELAKRCRSCSDLPNCDLDFCLRWWH